jgi:hypothetical protein
MSIYMIYSFVKTGILNRADQAEKEYKQYLAGPAADKDMLPQDAEMLARWLVKRADHLTNF